MDSPNHTTLNLDPPAPQPVSESLRALFAPRYELLRELGRGGAGVVYQARDHETGETVALKLLRPEIATAGSMAERFKNELRLARRITHRNVCRIHDYHRAGVVAYISMEYIEGESLRALMDRLGALPPARVRDIARQVCAGLREAHAQGIVHRDLKPENLMIARDGTVKLMDFGIARAIGTDTTTTQTVIGTPSYMAPEQLEGKGIDARTDLYALGLILYECLTGARAFPGNTPVGIALKQLLEKPRRPRRHVAGVPRALEKIVLRCLDRDPDRRFQSAAELDAALAGEPVTRPMPRRWLWGALAAAAALGAIAIALRRPSAPSASPAVATVTRAVAASPPPRPRSEPPPAPSPALTETPSPAPATPAVRTETAVRRATPVRDTPVRETVVATPNREAPRATGPAPAPSGRSGSPPPDDHPDLRRLREAAETGDGRALYEFARTLEQVRRGPGHLFRSYTLYALAAARGQPQARQDLERVAQQMDSPERRLAERRARELIELLERDGWVSLSGPPAGDRPPPRGRLSP